MRTVEIEIPDELMNWLEERACEEGISVQALVVSILEEALRTPMPPQESLEA